MRERGEGGRNQIDLSEISSNGSRLEIDCYLPNFNLGFEFQVCFVSSALLSFSRFILVKLTLTKEQQHYFHVNRGKESLFATQERDREKQELCEQKGITLLTIPFWWNYDKAR